MLSFLRYDLALSKHTPHDYFFATFIFFLIEFSAAFKRMENEQKISTETNFYLGHKNYFYFKYSYL